jgi:hypothetical protein
MRVAGKFAARQIAYDRGYLATLRWTGALQSLAQHLTTGALNPFQGTTVNQNSVIKFAVKSTYSHSFAFVMLLAAAISYCRFICTFDGLALKSFQSSGCAFGYRQAGLECRDA